MPKDAASYGLLKNPSSQLISQLVPKRDVADFLSRWCDRPEWEQRFKTQDLDVQFWANGLWFMVYGLWIKQVGIVAYSTLANFVIYRANMRSIGLEVKQESATIYLVQGSQQPFYAVHRQPSGQLKCECMLYRLRANRLQREVPIFFQAMNKKVFCHHTAAIDPVQFVRSSTKAAPRPRLAHWANY
jgi:hypothetical protein